VPASGKAEQCVYITFRSVYGAACIKQLRSELAAFVNGRELVLISCSLSLYAYWALG
jgi:hypothetical protein